MSPRNACKFASLLMEMGQTGAALKLLAMSSKDVARALQIIVSTTIPREIVN